MANLEWEPRVPTICPRPEVHVVQGSSHWEALETCSLPGVKGHKQPPSGILGAVLGGLKILLAGVAPGQRDYLLSHMGSSFGFHFSTGTSGLQSCVTQRSSAEDMFSEAWVPGSIIFHWGRGIVLYP